MILSTGIAISLLIWGIFHLILNFLEHTYGDNIKHFLWRNGIEISTFHISIFSKKFNRLLHQLSQFNVRIWFNTGVFVSILLMMGSVLTLVYNLWIVYKNITQTKEIQLSDEQVLQVVIPGVNMPFSTSGFLFVSVIISAFFHEIGHGIAAIKENVFVEGMGFFVFYCFPGAYVNMDKCDNLHPMQRLRIYCGGVWHNLVLSNFTYLLILVVPQLIWPFYKHQPDSVIIQYQNQGSPFSKERGLMTGDILKKLDDCELNGLNDWYYCINQTNFKSQLGSCIDTSSIIEFQNNKQEYNCCSDYPSKFTCYSYTHSNVTENIYSCLNPRKLQIYQTCRQNDECRQSQVCAIPFNGEKQRLVKIVVERNEQLKTIWYLGYHSDLFNYVKVTNYKPRLFIFSHNWPELFLMQLRFLYSISFGLGVINIVPCYFLDGEFAFDAILDLMVGVHRSKKKKITKVVLGGGTMLVAVNLIFSAYLAFT